MWGSMSSMTGWSATSTSTPRAVSHRRSRPFRAGSAPSQTRCCSPTSFTRHRTRHMPRVVAATGPSSQSGVVHDLHRVSVRPRDRPLDTATPDRRDRGRARLRRGRDRAVRQHEGEGHHRGDPAARGGAPAGEVRRRDRDDADAAGRGKVDDRRRARPGPQPHRPPSGPWKPLTSADACEEPPAIASLVREVAIVDSAAIPSAPPICCDVLIKPDARPASAGRMPASAAMEIGTNEKPRPTATSRKPGNRSPIYEPCTETWVKYTRPVVSDVIPITSTGFTPILFTSWAASAEVKIAVPATARYATPVLIGE